MKTQIKEQRVTRNYRLILYPDNAPSTGYAMTRQDLYALYVDLREMFQEGAPAGPFDEADDDQLPLDE
jgi:hypothetical protein